MKAKEFRVNWLVLVLGIALAGAGYALTKSYLGYQTAISSDEQLVVIVDHLLQDCHLNRALMQAQDTGCAAAAGSLDKLLAANIATVNTEVESADARARVLAEACFQHLARQRAQNPPTAADWPVGHSDRQLAAYGAFGQAPASASPGD
jgi:hypothetical protein